jgi:hypothetical protein
LFARLRATRTEAAIKAARDGSTGIPHDRKRGQGFNPSPGRIKVAYDEPESCPYLKSLGKLGSFCQLTE